MKGYEVLVVGVMLLGLVTIASVVPAEEPTGIEIIELYTSCAPLALLVEPLHPEGARRTDLTKEAIENAVESRLRAARIFAPLAEQAADKEQYLYVNVNISERAFGVRVSLERYIKDSGYGFGMFVVVWTMGGIGTHGDDGQYLLGIVSEHLDAFIASYLRVNGKYCK